MVSCKNMYQISAKALNKPTEAFGGMNMIFAGDFAQLLPVSGCPLFSPDSSVSSVIHAKMTLQDLENTMGKIIWKQVTTVVILKVNTQQNTESPDDTKFRTALSNMCYAACTPNDITFLKTWIVGLRKDQPKFSDTCFRMVPIITSWNAQKDRI
ncbi:hypothetical protein B0H10DRAFT_1764194, partial [Mycena sp. CBHHK59/15]